MIAAPVRPRRRLPLTPLIDVIFLLLLFFMLSSTFLRFSDVEVAAAQGTSGGSAGAGDIALLKLRFDGSLALGAETVEAARLPEAVAALADKGIGRLLLTADRGASVQALVEVLEIVERGTVPVILAAPPETQP